MPILNDQELNNAILKDLKDIIDEVTVKVLDAVRDSIQRNVYDAGTPKEYKRQYNNGGLMSSFIKQDAQISGQKVEASVDHDPMSMNNDPDDFIHGSNYWNTDDVRDMLAEMIINGGNVSKSPHVGPIFGTGFWTDPRDFWTEIEEMVKNNSIDKMIESAFNSRGIKWKKV